MEIGGVFFTLAKHYARCQSRQPDKLNVLYPPDASPTC